MAEYISKKCIYDIIYKHQRGLQNMGAILMLDVIVKEVLKLPIADVQPVKHGRWIEVTPKHSRCSVCDTTCLIAVYPISKGANYCPNCGARMDLKDGETNGRI